MLTNDVCQCKVAHTVIAYANVPIILLKVVYGMERFYMDAVVIKVVSGWCILLIVYRLQTNREKRSQEHGLGVKRHPAAGQTLDIPDTLVH